LLTKIAHAMAGDLEAANARQASGAAS